VRVMSRLMAIFFMVAVVVSGLLSGTVRVANAQDTVTSAGLVSGQWRIMAYESVISKEIPAFGLEANPNGDWVAIVADVTNLGVAAAFDPAALTVGVTTGSPLSMTAGVPADGGRTVAATQMLALQGISPEGVFNVGENSIVRVAAVFSVPAGPTGDQFLALRVGDQVASLADTLVAQFDSSNLPPFVPFMSLRQVSIADVPGNSQINVLTMDGTTENVSLAGIQTPNVKTGMTTGCFGPESASAVSSLSGGTLWLESVPGTDAQLAWVNDVSAGSFSLLNAQLVQQGLAGVGAQVTPYTEWFGGIEEFSKNQGAGLWAMCKNAQGAWINPPTPTPIPTPSAEQIRGQYAWIDARDLVIRPDEFNGEKVAVSGTVFNIMVEGNLTFIQIYVDGGNYDAVSIVYQGDSRGIYEDTWITVYGIGDGTFEGTNLYGGVISQPLIRADIIDF
jgi:endonuclease YncB( thermonuclease family)